MKLDVVVLAGNSNLGALKDCSDATNEALIKIGKRYMVEYVVDALRATSVVDKIVVAGDESQLAEIFGSEVLVTEGGESAIDTLLMGLNRLDTSAPVLVVCSDIPLVTAEAIEDFVTQCSCIEADLYYPIVPQRVVEAKFPQTRRTYVNLVEGIFTGGNVVLIRPEAVKKCADFARQVVQLRKRPVKLCQLLGLKLLLKFFLGKLSIGEIEQKLNDLLEITGVAVVSGYPELGVDVDKPVDLELAISNLDKTA